MLKSCFDTTLKNNKKNINISYLNKITIENDYKNFPIQKNLESSCFNFKKYLNKSNSNFKNDYPNEYSDQNYLSCKTCNGSGFIENFLNEIHKLEKDRENKYNNLEKNKHLTPYTICITCHGTGKKDSDAVFFYTCCQNKNKI